MGKYLFLDFKKTRKQTNNKTKWFILHHTNNIVLMCVFLFSSNTSRKQQRKFDTLKYGLKETKQENKRETKQQSEKQNKMAKKKICSQTTNKSSFVWYIFEF